MHSKDDKVGVRPTLAERNAAQLKEYKENCLGVFEDQLRETDALLKFFEHQQGQHQQDLASTPPGKENKVAGLK